MRKKIFALLLCICLGLLPASAESQPAAKSSHAYPGAPFAESISTLTGVAISPLLGTSAYGAVKYFRTDKDKRANLPWFAQPWFWIPALLLVAACFVKDTAGTALPTAVKKPLDVAETVENKISGLIATGAFVPIFIMMMTDKGGGPTASLASLGFAGIDLTPLYNILLIPIAMIAFFFVFLASNAINILILLSPFTTVDAALKSVRLALLGTVTATSWANPWMGAAWALVIIFISYFIAGWSFRLSHFGLVFIWDFFTGRRKRFKPDTVENKMFLGRKTSKVPARSYGKLARNEAGKLVFKYRPWLILKERTIELPEGDYEAGRGLLYSEIMRIEYGDRKTAFLLPPRYVGHEDELVKIYKLDSGHEVGLRAAMTWFKDLFGFKRVAANPA